MTRQASCPAAVVRAMAVLVASLLLAGASADSYASIAQAAPKTTTLPPLRATVPSGQGTSLLTSQNTKAKDVIIVPHWVPMNYTSNNNWHDLVTGIRDVNFKPKDDGSVLTSLKNIFASKNPFTKSSSQPRYNSPSHHALDFFLPEHIKQRQLSTAAQRSNNNIRRTLQLIEDESDEIIEGIRTRPLLQNEDVLIKRSLDSRAHRRRYENIKATWPSSRQRTKITETSATTIPIEISYGTTVQSTVPSVYNSPISNDMTTPINSWNKNSYKASETTEEKTVSPILRQQFRPSPSWPLQVQSSLEKVDRKNLFADQIRAGNLQKASGKISRSTYKPIPAKRVAILHIPYSNKLNTTIKNVHVISPGPTNTNVTSYFGPTLGKSLHERPVVSKASHSSKPYLIIPQTGKKIQLTNLSKPLADEITSERRHDLEKVGSIVRPIKDMFDYIYQNKQKAIQPVMTGISDLSGKLAVKFGPPKGEDVVSSYTSGYGVPAATGTSGYGVPAATGTSGAAAGSASATAATAAAATTTSAGLVTTGIANIFNPTTDPFQSNLRIRSAVPEIPLSLETGAIGDNILRFQRDDFQQSPSSFNFRTGEFGNDNEQPSLTFRVPETSIFRQPVTQNRLQGNPFQRLPLANEVPPGVPIDSFSSTAHSQFFIAPSKNTQFLQNAPLNVNNAPRQTNQQSFTFQSIGNIPVRNLPPTFSQVSADHFQEQFNSNINTRTGFGLPQQQSILIVQKPIVTTRGEHKTDHPTETASVLTSSSTSAINAGKSVVAENINLSRYPPLRAGFIQYPSGTSEPGRQRWPNTRLSTARPKGNVITSENGGKNLQQKVNELQHNSERPVAQSIAKETSHPQERPSRFRMPSFDFLNPFRLLFPRNGRKENKNSKRETVKFSEVNEIEKEDVPEKETQSFNIFKWLTSTNSRAGVEVEDNGSVTPFSAAITTLATPALGISAQIRNKVEATQEKPAPNIGPYSLLHSNKPSNSYNSNAYKSSSQDDTNSRLPLNHLTKSDGNQNVFFRTSDNPSPIYYIVNPGVLSEKFNSFHAVPAQSALLNPQNPVHTYTLTKEQPKTFLSHDKQLSSASRTELPSNFFEQRLRQLTAQYNREQYDTSTSEISSYSTVPDPNAIEVKPQSVKYHQFTKRRSGEIVPFNVEDIISNVKIDPQSFISSRMDDEETYLEDKEDQIPSASELFETFVEAPRETEEKDTFGMKNKLRKKPSFYIGGKETENTTLRSYANKGTIHEDIKLVKKLSAVLPMVGLQRGGEFALRKQIEAWAAQQLGENERQISPEAKVTKQYKEGAAPQSVNFTRVKWGFWQAADMDNRPIELQKIRIEPLDLPKIEMDMGDSYSSESNQNIIVIKAIPMNLNGESLLKNYKMEVSNGLDNSYNLDEITTSKPTTTYRYDRISKTTKPSTTTYPSDSILDSFKLSTLLSTTTPKTTTKMPMRSTTMTELRYTDINRDKISKTRNDVYIPGFHYRSKSMNRNNSDKQEPSALTTTTTTPPRTFPRSYYSPQARPLRRLNKVQMSQSHLKELSHFTTTTQSPDTTTTSEPNRHQGPWSKPLRKVNEPVKNTPEQQRNATPFEKYSSSSSKMSTTSMDSTTTRPINNSRRSRQKEEVMEKEESQIRETDKSNLLPKQSEKNKDDEKVVNTRIQSGESEMKPPYRSINRLRALLNRKNLMNKLNKIGKKVETNENDNNSPAIHINVQGENDNVENKNNSSVILQVSTESPKTEPTTKPVSRIRVKPERMISSLLNMRRRVNRPSITPKEHPLKATKIQDFEENSKMEGNTQEQIELPVTNDEQPVLGKWLNRIKNRLASYRAANAQRSPKESVSPKRDNELPETTNINNADTKPMSSVFESALKRFRTRMNPESVIRPNREIANIPSDTKADSSNKQLLPSKPVGTGSLLGNNGAPKFPRRNLPSLFKPKPIEESNNNKQTSGPAPPAAAPPAAAPPRQPFVPTYKSNTANPSLTQLTTAAARAAQVINTSSNLPQFIGRTLTNTQSYQPDHLLTNWEPSKLK